MLEFQTMANLTELAPGVMTLVTVACQDVVVANVVGAFFSFGNECTHVGGPLVEGELHGETVLPLAREHIQRQDRAGLRGAGHPCRADIRSALGRR